MTDPMEGVSEERITLEVTAGQHAELGKDQIYPGRARVVHKLSVGPFYLPGTWVVVATQQHLSTPRPKYLVTLARVEE